MPKQKNIRARTKGFHKHIDLGGGAAVAFVELFKRSSHSGQQMGKHLSHKAGKNRIVYTSVASVERNLLQNF
jgi:hypothetical protein